MRSRLLLLIPVALALGPGLPSARAQKPTPETLTTAQLQEHVERYLLDPTRQGELTELRRQLELDTRRLSYDAADRRASQRASGRRWNATTAASDATPRAAPHSAASW